MAIAAGVVEGDTRGEAAIGQRRARDERDRRRVDVQPERQPSRDAPGPPVAVGDRGEHPVCRDRVELGRGDAEDEVDTGSDT